MRDYNFFAAYQKKRSQQFNFNSPLFYFILVVLLILGVSGGLLVQNSMLSDAYKSLSIKLTTLQESNSYQEADVYTQSIRAMTEYDQYASSALENIQGGYILGTGFLGKMAAAMPSSTSLTSLNANTATVNFTANVPTKAAAAELLLRMQESQLFWQISLNSAVIANETGTYTATFDGVLKAGDQE
jgi:Tfp pilus assembly protein PilN